MPAEHTLEEAIEYVETEWIGHEPGEPDWALSMVVKAARELQAAQEREKVLDGALMIVCIWLAEDEVGIDKAQAYYDEAIEAQRTDTDREG